MRGHYFTVEFLLYEIADDWNLLAYLSGVEIDIPTCTIFYVRHDSVTRCWIKKIVQMFSKVAEILSTAVFTSIGLFQNSPKVNNLFGLLL